MNNKTDKAPALRCEAMVSHSDDLIFVGTRIGISAENCTRDNIKKRINEMRMKNSKHSRTHVNYMMLWRALSPERNFYRFIAWMAKRDLARTCEHCEPEYYKTARLLYRFCRYKANNRSEP